MISAAGRDVGMGNAQIEVVSLRPVSLMYRVYPARSFLFCRELTDLGLFLILVAGYVEFYVALRDI